MATSSYYKFNIFTQDIGNILHNLVSGGNSIYIALMVGAPAATDTSINTTATPCVMVGGSGSTELAAVSGYVKKGFNLTGQQFIHTSGVAKFYAAVATWTAGASMGPFRYAVVFNDTTGAAGTRPIIGYFDYGGNVTLGISETFTIGNSNDGTAWTSTYPMFTIT